MIRLGNRLNRLLALALDMPPEAFDEHFTWPRAGEAWTRDRHTGPLYAEAPMLMLCPLEPRCADAPLCSSTLGS